jgi:hypothetical protein
MAKEPRSGNMGIKPFGNPWMSGTMETAGLKNNIAGGNTREMRPWSVGVSNHGSLSSNMIPAIVPLDPFAKPARVEMFFVTMTFI